MRKILLMSSALVVSGLLSGVAEAACIQTPSCSSLGYTSSQSCNGGVKCPFGNAWNCTASDLSNKITELTDKITSLEEKIVTIESGTASSNCQIGDILYSDKSCSPDVISDKTPIGVVFSQVRRLAIALDTEKKTWSDSLNVPALADYSSSSEITADWQGKNNTRLVLEYCTTQFGWSCYAFEYVDGYKTDGTGYGEWYLPAMGELNAIYDSMEVLNTALEKVGGIKLPTDDYHWSSTENSSYNAWGLNFDSSRLLANKKNNNYYVRPVLAF